MELSMPMPARTVRLTPAEDRILARASTYAGLLVNDFIRCAIDEKIERMRILRDTGTPPQPRVERLPPRPGTRRKLVSALVDATVLRRLDRMFAENGARRSAYVRDAIAYEIAHPSTEMHDPARGPKEGVFPIMMTDTEHAALMNATALRGIRRPVFVRIAIANALARPIADSVDRELSQHPETSLESRQVEAGDPSRPDTTA